MKFNREYSNGDKKKPQNTGNIEKSRTYFEKKAEIQRQLESDKQVSESPSNLRPKSVPVSVGNKLQKSATDNVSTLKYDTLHNDATRVQRGKSSN
jgi:hypothetical protein